jgi:predicted Zn finger-like uncharacterized protein
MYTDCPSCRRQFRLNATQLSAARGLVQCGYCGEQFNALERLHDKPLPRPRVSVPVIDKEAGDQELPSFNLAEEEAQIGAAEPDLQIEEEEEIEPPDAGKDEQDYGFKIELPVSRERSVSAVAEEAVKEEADEEEADEEKVFEVRRPPVRLPPQLQQDEAPPAKRRSRVLWGLAIVLLLLAGAGQAAWFNRDALLSRYPQLLPWARQVCEYFQCELIRFRDVSAIKLLNRDVRDHPRYEDALLVNATIVNQAGLIQPFPVVQLGLFDTDGKVIGERKFRPAEYLDKSMDMDAGMLPGKPVHIVLEVTGPTQGAVSFEFRFLEN